MPHPLPPSSYCFPLDSFRFPSTLLCFCLPIPVLGVPSILGFSCRDLFWPGSSGLALRVGLFRATHPLAWLPPLTHSGPMCSPSQFNPLGLLSLALRPSPTWAALHPAAALDVPFSSQFSIPASFLFQIPGDPTFPPVPPTQHGAGAGQTLKVLGISSEEVGKLAGSVWFPWVGGGSSESRQLWQRPWEAGGCDFRKRTAVVMKGYDGVRPVGQNTRIRFFWLSRHVNHLEA